MPDPAGATDTTGAGRGGAVAVVTAGRMKLLTAGAGNRPDDFARTVPGEVVFPGEVCGRDDVEQGGDGTCGCGRAFTGAASRHPTTVAIVTEREMDLEQLEAVLLDSARSAGWTVDANWAAEFAADLADEAAEWPVGTRLRRTLDDELVPE